MKVVEEKPTTSTEEVDVKYLNGQEINITKDYSSKYAYQLVDSSGEKYFTDFNGFLLYSNSNKNNITLSDNPDGTKTKDDNTIPSDSDTSISVTPTIPVVSETTTNTGTDSGDNGTLVELNGHEIYVTKDYGYKYAYKIVDSSGEEYYTDYNGYLLKGKLGLDKVSLSSIIGDKKVAGPSGDTGSGGDTSYGNDGSYSNIGSNYSGNDTYYEGPTNNYSSDFSSLLNSSGFLDLTKFDDSDAREVNKTILDNSSSALNSTINNYGSTYSDIIGRLGSEIIDSTYAGTSIKDLERIFSSSLDSYSDELNQQLSESIDCLDRWADNKIELKANAEEFNSLTAEKYDLIAQIEAHKAKEPKLSDGKYTRTRRVLVGNDENGNPEYRDEQYQDSAAFSADHSAWEAALKQLEASLNDVMNQLDAVQEQIEEGLQRNKEYENLLNQYSEAISKLAVLSDEGISSDLDTLGNLDLKDKNLKNFYSYDQNDSRWAHYSLSSANYKMYGCGPSCLAMVLRYYTGNSDITPVVIGDFAKNTFNAVGLNGTYGDVYFEKAAASYGVNCRQVSNVKGVDSLCTELNNGNMLIMGNRGHYITLVGMTNNNEIVVSDPYGDSNDGAYTLQDFEKKFGVGWQVYAFNNNGEKSA